MKGRKVYFKQVYFDFLEISHVHASIYTTSNTEHTLPKSKEDQSMIIPVQTIHRLELLWISKIYFIGYLS